MSGVQGAIEDSAGQVYFATPLGIQFCEANGRVAGILNPPEHGNIGGLAFAGKDLNWIYLTEGGKLFRRSVKVAGVAVDTPTKPPKPRNRALTLRAPRPAPAVTLAVRLTMSWTRRWSTTIGSPSDRGESRTHNGHRQTTD